MTELDTRWLAAHPLPVHGPGTTKNSRGHVLAVGGGAFVPGVLRLTGEAALRAGCGKLRMATIAAAAAPLGVLVPEAASIPLPADADGEIDGAAASERLLRYVAQCDTLVLGPGMGGREGPRLLVEALLAEPDPGRTIVLDAACLACAGELTSLLCAHAGRLILTPHHGEAARLMEIDEAAVAADPELVAREASRRFRAVVTLKASETLIAAPEGTLLRYRGGGVGLATGGSGDLLAGLIGGLSARGASPLEAAAWGVWLHGEAGRRASERLGPIGFLARDLLEDIPRLMTSHRT